MSDLELIDWIYLKDCIEAHERVTGKKPACVSVPFPKGFLFQGVEVSLYSGQKVLTGDTENVIHHDTLKHRKPLPTPPLTIVK